VQRADGQQVLDLRRIDAQDILEHADRIALPLHQLVELREAHP
jgi:hypothetical protein